MGSLHSQMVTRETSGKEERLVLVGGASVGWYFNMDTDS